MNKESAANLNRKRKKKNTLRNKKGKDWSQIKENVDRNNRRTTREIMVTFLNRFILFKTSNLCIQAKETDFALLKQKRHFLEG